MKYINFKRYKFTTVLKSFDSLAYNLIKIFKIPNFKKYDFKKILKYLNISKLNFSVILKYLSIATFSTFKIARLLTLKKYNINFKKINFLKSKVLFIHTPLAIIFFSFLYLSIPTFFNYDKMNIENTICKNIGINCKINGSVSYRFFPTPRLKIKDIVIKDSKRNNNNLVIAKNVSIILSFQNLLAKDKHKFKKIELSKFKTNLNINSLKNYENIFNKKNIIIPLFLSKGEVIFNENDKEVAVIENANIETKFIKGFAEIEIKGKFLQDDVYINFNSSSLEQKVTSNLILKMSDFNFLTKANFIYSEKDKNTLSGNFLIKQNKNKIAGLFDYKDKKIQIKKSNLKNPFINGNMFGNIVLLPYFGFNLDLSLNSINFTKLYNYFLALEKEDKVKLFKLNNKINGKINFSADKVYSKHDLVKSFESRLKFYNGNLNIEQLLINLGKLGAADLVGTLVNDKKFTNFKFESNIFVDNKKKFASKFGIYNKERMPPSLFISGNFDFKNIKMSLYEVSAEKKLSPEDTNYVETEFNDFILEDGYKNLFNFLKFKGFLKSIEEDKN